MRLAAIFLAFLSTPALALPPAGVYPDDAEHLWWECHVQPATKVICCRVSDGHVLGDNEWRVVEKADGGRAYQVRVGAKWYDVPAKTVINDSHHCGLEPNLAHQTMAKVWYAPTWVVDKIVDIQIHCFIAGTMY
jgi:hypothetical protein